MYFFFPASQQPVSPHNLCHWGLFPKLIYMLLFHTANARSISSMTHGVTTVSTLQSGIKVSTFQLTYGNPLQLCSQCTMMQNKVSLLKCQQFICTAAGWGCPYGWCTSAKVAATFTRRFCFIRLSSAALLGLCSQSFFQPHLSVQQPSLNICRVSSVTN